MSSQIEPHIAIGEPGQNISLYTGQLEVRYGDKTFIINDCRVLFMFLPQPRIEFHFLNADELVMSSRFSRNFNLQIKLPSYNIFVDAIIINRTTRNSKITCLQANKPDFNLQDKLSLIKFYIPNFHFILRPIKLRCNKWEVIISQLNKSKDIEEYLKYSNNYAVTHIAEAFFQKSKDFTIEDANNLIKALYYFFSFCRGIWIAPILINGFDSNNIKKWEILETNVDSWKSSRSWLPLVDSANIENAFSGFWYKWTEDTSWQEVIKLAIYWYIPVSKQSGGQEASVILTQAALEMLASVVLVEDRNIISTNGFEKLDARDKISMLLNQCSIPLEIPSTLNALVKYAKAFNYTGTQTITEFRNHLIHPKLKNREKLSKIPYEVIIEIYLLGKWYLELVILNLLGYEGNYLNWTKKTNNTYSDGEAVPWVTDRQ